MKPIRFACGLALFFITMSVSQSATQPAFSDQVTIRRDTYGVPHILGETEEAAAFGLGYAQAEDHAVEIARRLVSARAQQAKHFGSGADTDFLLKQFDNYEVCRTHFRDLDPLMQRIFRAYIAGVNHYIAKHRADLPEWIPVFNEIDVMAHIRQGAVTSVRGVIGNLRRKYEPRSTSEPWGDEFDDTGSNALALGPSRTTSGKAILLGNPHLSWSSLYWEAHITVPGKVNFFGSTLPGYPVLRAGFNEYLGWVTTNNSPDMADVFSLEINPERVDHYIFEGKSLPLLKREVAVEIKGADGNLTTETRTFERSHLGVIIYRTNGRAFVYRSTQLESFRHFEGFYRLSKARNLKQWMAVMNLNLTNYSNFTYADADGNILYLWNAQLPKRPDDGTNYSLDIPAQTASRLWKGLHRVAEFPRLLNPAGGYLQNCNNPPWFASLRDPIDPSNYPSYFERGELSLRPQLALEMLESQAKFSLEDVKQLKFNTKMLLADRLKPDLVAAIHRVLKTSEASEDLVKGLGVIEAWDNRASAEAKGAVLFQRFADTYLDATEKPFRVEWDSKDPGRTPVGIADPVVAVKHFEDAVKWTRQKYGREDMEWGAVHRFRFKDVDLPAEGASGRYGAFRVMGFSETPDGKRTAGWTSDSEPLSGSGDAWVLAVEFSRPVRAFSVVAYGQTTNSNSKHSRDQIGLFANRQYKPVWFSEAEIRTNLQREYRP